MDRDEFARIVDHWYDDVKRIAFAGCKNIYDAEDIAQGQQIALPFFDS